MDIRAEVRQFLTSRRARIAPEQVGLPAGGQRRVKGLRRGEVAQLAGISVEYYANLARFQFLDPASRVYYPEWETMARMCVSAMRMTAPRTPGSRAFQSLVGELSTTSAEFRRLWAAHDVRIHGHGVKAFQHPEVGRLDLAYEELAVTAEPGLAVHVYSAEPGSAGHDKLRLLGALASERNASSSLHRRTR